MRKLIALLTAALLLVSTAAMAQEVMTVYTNDTYSIAYPSTWRLDSDDADGLNYLAGRDLSEICRVAADAVRDAHVSGGVPNIVIEIPKRDEEGFAAMVCFFELACAISGYMSQVNPFDQPGVEAYKKNMFRMLGKPGAV